METKKRRWPVIILIIFILVVAALYIYLYLFPQITDSLKETYTVSYDKFENTEKLHCIIVRDEQVVYAEHSGAISRYSKETEKTRKNFTVADIYAGNAKYSMGCPSTGFVSYYIDGRENYFTPDKLASLDIEEYKDLELTPENKNANDVVIGEPVYKLITSNTWYILLIVPETQLEQYALNSKVSVIMPDETAVSATVTRFLGDGETRAVVCATKLFYPDFAKLRSLDLDVISKSVEGLRLPLSAVVTQDEKTGVMVLGVDDEYSFREIEIIADDGEFALVSQGQNLRLYDEILRNAKSD